MNCPHCGKRYKYPTHLYKHIEAKHSEHHNNGKSISSKNTTIKEMVFFHLNSVKTLLELIK